MTGVGEKAWVPKSGRVRCEMCDSVLKLAL